MKKTLLLAALMIFGVAASSQAAGANLGLEPPAGVLVQRAGLEWIWAGPCANDAPSCGVAVDHHGFANANDAQWLASFANLADLYAAFHAGGQKCGSPWMNSVHNHCDSGDLQAGFVWHSPFAPSDAHRNNALSEGFKVRAAVPEPGTMILLGTGLLVAVRARRRQKNAIAS